ncbi:hypothetical protein HDU76_007392 [Blyttiomyces sp. JEL0837]|nr:hypothetical protein HDU76_007392 [Blyttiomyces sp. JEL0837]
MGNVCLQPLPDDEDTYMDIDYHRPSISIQPGTLQIHRHSADLPDTHDLSIYGAPPMTASYNHYSVTSMPPIYPFTEPPGSMSTRKIAKSLRKTMSVPVMSVNVNGNGIKKDDGYATIQHRSYGGNIDDVDEDDEDDDDQTMNNKDIDDDINSPLSSFQPPPPKSWISRFNPNRNKKNSSSMMQQQPLGPLILPRSSSLTAMVFNIPEVATCLMNVLSVGEAQRLSRVCRTWREACGVVISRKTGFVTLEWEIQNDGDGDDGSVRIGEWSCPVVGIERWGLDVDLEEVGGPENGEIRRVDSKWVVQDDGMSKGGKTKDALFVDFDMDEIDLLLEESLNEPVKKKQNKQQLSKRRASATGKSFVNVTKYIPITFNNLAANSGPLPVPFSKVTKARLTPRRGAPPRSFNLTTPSNPQTNIVETSTPSVSLPTATTAVPIPQSAPLDPLDETFNEIFNLVPSVVSAPVNTSTPPMYPDTYVAALVKPTTSTLLSTSPSSSSSSSKSKLTTTSSITKPTNPYAIHGKLPRRDHVFSPAVFGLDFGIVMDPSGCYVEAFAVADDVLVGSGGGSGRGNHAHGMLVASKSRWEELVSFAREVGGDKGIAVLEEVKESVAMRYYLSVNEGDKVWAFRAVMETLLDPLHQDPESGSHILNDRISRIDRIAHRIDILCQVDVPGIQRLERLKSYFGEVRKCWCEMRGFVGELSLRVSGFSGGLKGNMDEGVFDHLVGVLVPAIL